MRFYSGVTSTGRAYAGGNVRAGLGKRFSSRWPLQGGRRGSDAAGATKDGFKARELPKDLQDKLAGAHARGNLLIAKSECDGCSARDTATLVTIYQAACTSCGYTWEPKFKIG